MRLPYAVRKQNEAVKRRTSLSPAAVGKKQTVILSAALSFIILAGAMLTTDTVRTKLYGLPPVFCVQLIVYDDGISCDYYGVGYKIWCDYNGLNDSPEYRISLWLLPKQLSI